MPELHVPDLRQGYIEVVEYVRDRGAPVSPRGQATREVLDAVVVLEDPTDALPVGIGRKLNPAIAAAEALQLIGGFSDPALMTRVTPNFAQFKDAGVFHGAYGPRVRPQLPAVVERLKKDRDTRQALVVLWDPMHDLFVQDSRDYPCTTMLQFLVRKGRLVLHTTMRSNDVWWGLAYDAFQFTQLQLTVADVLGIPAGPYHHHAVSLHIYDRDLPALAKLHSPLDAEPPTDRPTGLTGYDSIEAAMWAARSLAAGDSGLDRSEQWYQATLAPYVEAA